MEYVLHFDGGCEPRNPGGTGVWGFFVSAPGLDGLADCGHLDASPDMTNNVAEYVALGKGLRFLTSNAAFELVAGDVVRIRGDSKLVVEQLNGKWNCNAPRLQKLLARCRELLSSLPCEWSAEWVPREANARADELTRKAYLDATGSPMPERAPKAPGKNAAPTTGRCDSCSAPILWVKTVAGKRMPLDAEPVNPAEVAKTCVIEGGVARFDTTKAPAGAKHYRSHFAVCPGATTHRRPRERKSKSEPPPDDDEPWSCPSCGLSVVAGSRCGACGGPATARAILGTIPEEYAAHPAVRQLAADAAAKGDPAWAAELVGLVDDYFAAKAAQAPACRTCGGKTIWLCSTCRVCVEKENRAIRN